MAVTLECNYRCRFCFGKYKTLGKTLDSSRLLDIPRLLAEAGCQKITFEGGEPLLNPKIFRLVDRAKDVGLTTCLVTNGSLLTLDKLARLSENLDWLGLSVDSAIEETETALGRGSGNHANQIIKVADWAHDLGIALKINAVITKLNCREDMKEFIKSLKPRRFKAFQVLVIRGENESACEELRISHSEFDHFTKNHQELEACGISFVPESQDDMIGSYIMMLPDGNFYSNLNGAYNYSERNIFDEGVDSAFRRVGWDRQKFFRRGGQYPWAVRKDPLLRRGSVRKGGGRMDTEITGDCRGGERNGF
ncbi:MAG: viperin family antiviral radical SAM protein [Thermoplasmata archaeon]|nr:viperin family antiviral radical SAM protein [Thermoplasmata archaeon]